MFNYTIKHKPGKADGNANYLSRCHVDESRDSDENDFQICHVNATPIPTVLELPNSVVRRARLGISDVSFDQENILTRDATSKTILSYSNEELIKWQKDDVYISKVTKTDREKVRMNNHKLKNNTFLYMEVLRNNERD